MNLWKCSSRWIVTDVTGPVPKYSQILSALCVHPSGVAVLPRLHLWSFAEDCFWAIGATLPEVPRNLWPTTLSTSLLHNQWVIDEGVKIFTFLGAKWKLWRPICAFELLGNQAENGTWPDLGTLAFSSSISYFPYLFIIFIILFYFSVLPLKFTCIQFPISRSISGRLWPKVLHVQRCWPHRVKYSEY